MAETEDITKMVIKCERTGKIFFSHKEAELHSEETGLKEFAQVSSTEKVWVCKETGKVCFNQTQVDLHRRRVPEAETFDEKTIGDLAPAAKAKAEESAGVAMETDDDVIARASGMAGKLARFNKKSEAAAAAAGPPVVTKESVDALLEMGFTEVKAQKALLRTANAGVEPAINWLADHGDDADIDAPIAEAFEVKTAEEVGAAAAAAAAAGGSQLTPAEKKAKLDAALAKARAKKAGMSAEDAKAAEKARIEGGKQTVAQNRAREDQQRKRDQEARAREKREFEEERKKLREKIAADKAARIAKNGPTPAAAYASAPAPAPAPAPAAAPKKPETEKAAAAAAAAGGLRSYDEPALSVAEATEKLGLLSDTKVRPAIDMLKKMADNVAKAPAEPKYRKVRLSNPKVADGLVHVPGARQFLRAIGWQLVAAPEGGPKEFLELPVAADAAAQAAAQVEAVAALGAAVVAAQEARRKAELEANKKRIADEQAKKKAERDAVKAQMARDRGEVAARGPAQASVAKKLPTEGGGMKVFVSQEDEEERARQGR